MHDDDLPQFEKFKKKSTSFSNKQIWSMCSRKFKYRTMFLANVVIQKALNERGEILRAYHCPICGNVHVTKTDRTKVSNL